MIIQEKHKFYALCAIFGVAGLILYYNLLLKPQFSAFIARNKEFGVVMARVKSEKALINNEAGFKKQYENFKSQAGYLEKMLPSQDQVSSILENFSNMAESSGVKILRIKPLETVSGTVAAKQKAVVNNAYSEFPILIEAKAGYHQLGVFVNKLENMERFIKVTDIEIAGAEKDPRHHDIKLRVMTYVLQ